VTHIDPALLQHATPAELQLIEQALRTEVALSSPAEYAAYCDPSFLRPDHIELISDTVVRLINAELIRPDGQPYRKLAVSMPPRHGKSEMISRFTPAWFVTKYPEARVVLASYEGDFAAQWGRKARELVEEHPELGVKVSAASKAAALWDVAGHRGGMSTAGVGGPVTGKGGAVLIVDDPVKNAEEAQSATMRDRAWDWWRSTLSTRGQAGLPKWQNGVIIVLQTRWHEDDLLGRLLKEEGDEWFVLSLPAIAGDRDPLGRLPGEALWPEKFDAATLNEMRVSMGSYWWSSLYQQSPQIEGGGLFRADALRYHTYNRTQSGNFARLIQPEGPPKVVPESRMGRFMVVDLAASLRTTADYSVFGHFGVTPDKELLLLDAYRARIEGAEHMEVLERLYNAWKPRFVAIEKATFGLSLIQTAVRVGRIPVRELKPDWDKVSRAYAAGALAESGRLYLPKDAPWLSDWVSELVGFPNATHDDCVDVTAYAAHLLNQTLMPPRRNKAPEDTGIEARAWALLSRKRKKDTHPELGAM
jgi:predicted phage terminase large subunit-like protein